MKTDADGVVKALQERPLDFEAGTYCLVDKATGIEYWIGNGLFFYGVHRPQDYNFSLFGKIKFAKALREWRRNWLIYKNVETKLSVDKKCGD